MTKSKRRRNQRQGKLVRKAYRTKRGLLKEEVRTFEPSILRVIFTSKIFLFTVCWMLLLTLFETARV